MNKAIGFGLMLALLIASVSAALDDTTGFFLEKNVLVTGDWKWENDGWQYGNYPTASFNMDTHSHMTTQAAYIESEKLGDAWKYDLSAMTQTNARTSFDNTLNVITVNSPLTTPATGGWTRYEYDEMTAGKFTSSQLEVCGYGNAIVSSISLVKGDSAFQQIGVNIN